jgi:hypothetical protein
MNSDTGIGTGEQILLAEILRRCDTILQTLTVCSSSSKTAGGGARCTIGGLGGDGGASVLGGTVDTNSGNDALTVICGDAMATINISGAMGGKLDTHNCGSLVAVHRHIRIAIGPGSRRKPWGGCKSLARAREEHTVEGNVAIDVHINDSISMSSASLGTGNVAAVIGAIGAICSGGGSITIGGGDANLNASTLRVGGDDNILGAGDLGTSGRCLSGGSDVQAMGGNILGTSSDSGPDHIVIHDLPTPRAFTITAPPLCAHKESLVLRVVVWSSFDHRFDPSSKVQDVTLFE